MYDNERGLDEDYSDQKNRRANRFRSKRRHVKDDYDLIENVQESLDSRIGTMVIGEDTVYYCFNGPDIVKGTRAEIESYLGV